MFITNIEDKGVVWTSSVFHSAIIRIYGLNVPVPFISQYWRSYRKRSKKFLNSVAENIGMCAHKSEFDRIWIFSWCARTIISEYKYRYSSNMASTFSIIIFMRIKNDKMQQTNEKIYHFSIYYWKTALYYVVKNVQKAFINGPLLDS